MFCSCSKKTEGWCVTMVFNREIRTNAGYARNPRIQESGVRIQNSKERVAKSQNI